MLSGLRSKVSLLDICFFSGIWLQSALNPWTLLPLARFVLGAGEDRNCDTALIKMNRNCQGFKCWKALLTPKQRLGLCLKLGYIWQHWQNSCWCNILQKRSSFSSLILQHFLITWISRLFSDTRMCGKCRLEAHVVSAL